MLSIRSVAGTRVVLIEPTPRSGSSRSTTRTTSGADATSRRIRRPKHRHKSRLTTLRPAPGRFGSPYKHPNSRVIAPRPANHMAGLTRTPMSRAQSMRTC